MGTKLVADHWRGLDFYKPSQDKLGHAIIVGCGATGSYVALGLARMGVKELTLIDHDTVEGHNIPNQFFAESLNLEEGILKVNILASTIKLIVPNVKINIFPMKWEEINQDELKLSTAIFTMVDDMPVREKIFNSDYIGCRNTKFLLDSRTGGLYANIFCVELRKMSSIAFYKGSLHSNSESAPLPCSGQSIVDVSMCVAGELVGRYRTCVMKGSHPILHSFHDYSLGISYPITTYKNIESDNEISVTDEDITKIGVGNGINENSN